MDLVPQNDSFVVEAKLEPTDINDVYPGQPVDIRFSAFNAKTTPLIEGEVISVSADRLLDDANQRPYYLVRIQITEAGQRTLQDRPLLPGMPAEAMIRRGDRTLFSYLFKPLTDSFARSLKED
jgi:epimerase transport system membrane fusion protein